MAWDESKHPRIPKGNKGGGRFDFKKGYSSTTGIIQKIIRIFGRLKLPDEQLPRSVGAKWRNEKVLDLKTGKYYRFVEGSKLQDVEVFAGYGTRFKYRKGIEYATKIGGLPEEWQHAKAKAELSTGKGTSKAEVHWSQHKKYGKFDFFVKRWL
ncbi:MAG: hypothetical protein IJY65_04245 [Clostridia bacterium]|nr:hypothetical protein [Clostridia bacterium]